MDAYCGCGTTVAVAHRLNRQWIGIDITYQSISLILRRMQDVFGEDIMSQIKINGIPKDVASAEALATRQDDRTRKEFEKWAILTYSKNRATVNQKKWADKGVDGFAFFLGGGSEGQKRIVLQVKSGNISPHDIRDLYGTMTREEAAMAFFITLKKPTSAIGKEASSCGIYHHKVMGKSYPCVQIITIKEMLAGKRLEIPLSLEVLRSAERQVAGGEQLTIPQISEELVEEIA